MAFKFKNEYVLRMQNFYLRIICAMFVIGMVMLSACGKHIDVVEWNEEIKLSDDSTVVIWRKDRAKSSGFPDAARGENIDFEIRYDPENVHWQGDSGVYHQPMSFDRVNGDFYLVRHAQTIKACRAKKPEEYAIQILKWENLQWKEIAQLDAPLDRLRINLSHSPWGHNPQDDTKGLLRINGQDDRPVSINRSGRDDRANPELIQAYFERTAIDPRTKQRAPDLYQWNPRFCGYWHRVIPVSTTPEETRQRLEEAKKKFDEHKEHNLLRD